MPESSSSYRKINTFEFRPVYTSLGIDRSAFTDGSRPGSKIFDAALNAGPLGPDILWLFKGTKYYRYDLAKKRFESEDIEIAGNWGGSTWPLLFSSGIDAAAWGGPSFPNYWYMFKENKFIRLNSEGGGCLVVDIPPQDIAQAWWSAHGTWFANGCGTALAGRIAQDDAKIHLFGGGGQYIRHNLLNGYPDIGPKPIREQFNLPEPFASAIDLSFYDQGHAVFFSGDMCGDFDLRHNEVLDIQTIERRFPAFAKFQSRPQIFLVESYSLETYVGPPIRGKLVDTRSVERGTTLKLKLVTETVSSSQTTLHESILESQRDDVMRDYNEKMDNHTHGFEGSDTYRYQMDADFHGEASANSLWGGEVNAQLAIRGGTDSNRKSFAEAAFKSVSSQVRTASESITQKAYTAGQTIEHLDRVINQQDFEVVGDRDHTRITEFYQRLEPYCGLLVLKDVRIGYGDGSGTGLAPVSLSALPRLLAEKLVRQEDRARLLGYLRDELAAIADERGQVTTIFVSGATSDVPAFELKTNPTTTFEIQLPDGQTQSVVVRGLLIKAAKDWLSPTTQMLPVDVQ
jgi:hypothetical protein